MSDPFDSSRYTLDELVDAREHVDAGANPERAAELDRWIAVRRAEARAAREAPIGALPGQPKARSLSPLATCGLIAAVVAGSVVSLSIFLIARAALANGDSQKAATRIVREVTGSWSIAALRANATPELNKIVSDADARRLFAMWSKLGRLEQLGVGSGQATSRVGFGSMGSGVTAEYRFDAKFSNAPATITIVIVSRDGVWKLDTLTIVSPLFLPPA